MAVATKHIFDLYTRAARAPFARTGVSRQWTTLDYTRRAQATGEFTLTIPEEAPELQNNLLEGTFLEIVRDGATEMLAFVAGGERTLDEQSPATSMVTFKGWNVAGYMLHTRCAVPPSTLNYYGNSGNAEAVILAAITDHIVNPQDATRAIAGTAVQALHSPALGLPLVINLHGDQLDTAVAQMALAGNVCYDAQIQNGKLTFTVYQGVDRASAGVPYPIIFDPAKKDLLRFKHQRDLTQLQNRIYVMGGDGTAAARFTAVVNNATSQAMWGIWEAFVDGSNAFNTTIANQQGAAVLAAKSLVDRIAFVPRNNAQRQYRLDWDLGDTVTYHNATWNGLLGSAPVVEVQVSVRQGQGELVTASLNLLPQSVIRTIRAQLAALTPVLYGPQLPVLSDGRIAYAQFAADPTGATGSPLRAGQTYFNTTVNQLKYYDGSVWRLVNFT